MFILPITLCPCRLEIKVNQEGYDRGNDELWKPAGNVIAFGVRVIQMVFFEGPRKWFLGEMHLFFIGLTETFLCPIWHFLSIMITDIKFSETWKYFNFSLKPRNENWYSTDYPKQTCCLIWYCTGWKDGVNDRALSSWCWRRVGYWTVIGFYNSSR